VAKFEEGKPPLLSAVPTFSPQSYYSEITGFTTTKRGRVGSKYTEQNQRLAGGALRPHSFRLNDVEKADAPAAVKAKMGRMFGQMLSIVVDVPTLRDPSGKLWKANTTVTLKAPGAMVYAETEFLVRDVFLRPSTKQVTTAFGLVLPGAFSGEVPSRLPWDEA
jgi:prophage tail gpP-like protein